MGILNSQALLKDKYDIIIIGAGLGALTAGELQAELNQMISKRINLKYNWELNGKDQLVELKENYDSVFLTAPSNINLKEFSGLKNIIIGGRWYSNNPEGYYIVESIRDGRQAAQKIHNFF